MDEDEKPKTEGELTPDEQMIEDETGTSGEIVVDSRLATSNPRVWAAGDVTGKYQFTHAAGYEGGIVIANTIFRLPRKADYTWMPWCTYTDPELASIGLNEKRARAQGVDYAVWEESFASNDRALAEGEGRGKLKTPETICYEIFREILREARAYQAEGYRVLANQKVVDRLLDEESGNVAELEAFIGRTIRFQVESMYSQEQYDVVLL